MRKSWQAAEVSAVRPETARSRTIRLRFPDAVTGIAGQHVDLRLTAGDGYQAVRSYSVAGWIPPDELEVTIEELKDGEVSPFLVNDLAPGDELEVRGPVGGWFTWTPDQEGPLQLIAGGSGVVPLMAMLRAHSGAGSAVPARLLYSVRGPEQVFYGSELAVIGQENPHVTVDFAYSREAPDGQPVGRLTREAVMRACFPPEDLPSVYVCGSTGFVEAVASWLVDAGHEAGRIRTERYGG
ncbi:FAD-binding oxidoreductase [uncultured Arthrobacter sp.]|uniref:FAD-binding oxidoreductase n=1 Tax=uncultured Arthrobacter sp. TaxID=114050 RepID=UPI0025DC7860|nr:FAD-binding oxidoreductase [uncultured Arthrobacter sp.]